MKSILLTLLTTFLSLTLLPAQTRGEKAYAFELKDTLGYVHRLEDYKDKTLVMDFWFTGCKGCVQVAQMLREQVKPHFKGDTSVVFIAVSLDVNFLQWKQSIRGGLYTSKEQINLFTNGVGSSHPIYKYYGFLGAPQLLVIDSDGYMVSKSVTISGVALVDLIRETLAFRSAEKMHADFHRHAKRQMCHKELVSRHGCYRFISSYPLCEGCGGVPPRIDQGTEWTGWHAI